MLTILKTLVILADLFIIAILTFFLHPLRWQNEKERPSIIGFSFMIVTILADVALIVIG